MDMNTVKERVFYNETVGTKKESDNTWKLIVTIGEKITLNDGTVKEEKVQAMSIDDDFHSAQRIALRAALHEIDDLVNSRGFDTLIEGKEYQRSLEKSNGGDTNNQVTTS